MDKPISISVGYTVYGDVQLKHNHLHNALWRQTNRLYDVRMGAAEDVYSSVSRAMEHLRFTSITALHQALTDLKSK